MDVYTDNKKLKAKAICPNCGAINTEKNAGAHGTNEIGQVQLVGFNCWNCQYSFVAEVSKKKIEVF
jgi:rubredoxin